MGKEIWTILLLLGCFCCLVEAKIDIDDEWEVPTDDLLLDEQNIAKASRGVKINPEELERLASVIETQKVIDFEDVLSLADLFARYYVNQLRSISHDDQENRKRVQMKISILSDLPKYLRPIDSRCTPDQLAIFRRNFDKAEGSNQAMRPLFENCYRKQVEHCRKNAISLVESLLSQMDMEDKMVFTSICEFLDIDGSARKVGLVRPRSDAEYAQAVLDYIKVLNGPLKADMSQEDLSRLIKRNLFFHIETRLEVLEKLSKLDGILPNPVDDLEENQHKMEEQFYVWTERAANCIVMSERMEQILDEAHKLYKETTISN